MITVPFFNPDIDEAEEAAVLAVLRSNWITMGPQTEELESRFAALLGSDHAVALSSCTAALHLAYLLVQAGPGDEIIVPSLTFSATANAVTYTGATPVFADITGDGDWTISPQHVEDSITPRTRAVVAMHYAGYPADMRALSEICDRRGVTLLEDACHGIGADVDGRKLGTHGTIGCFSFYSNKGMTTAEGGMLVTDDAELARRARLLRSHGQTKTAIDRVRGAVRYDIAEIGFNYRMDDIRASIGLAQMDKLEGFADARQRLVKRYRQQLQNIPGVAFPTHGDRGKPANYLLPVLLAQRFDRDQVQQRLNDRGIQTSMHYPPVHLFSHYLKFGGANLPKTERVAQSCLTLPLYPSMPLSDVDRVCDSLAAVLDETH